MKQLEELKGKDVELIIRYKNDSRKYFYHGEILEIDKINDKIWTDDFLEGRIWFWRSQIISFREMEYHDYLKLAPKSERAKIKLKMWQAEMKVSDTARDIKKKLFGG